MFVTSLSYFFFNATATTEIYTLSLHDALPIYWRRSSVRPGWSPTCSAARSTWPESRKRSEEHTSELQSLTNLVCRLLLEKKKKYHFYFDSCNNHENTLSHSVAPLLSVYSAPGH